jgi:hypothetical protein
MRILDGYSVRLAAFAACAALSTAMLWSQSYQGGIRGRVIDSTGAAIANAKVTATEAATGVSRATLSNNIGEYVFNALNPADYRIVAESPGFKIVERPATVQTQTFLTLDLTLEIGNVTESVLVTEEAPLIESSNASTGQVVDRQKLIDLPNLGRNPFMMSKIAQNVVPVGNPVYNRMQDQSGSSQISIAGGPVRGNNYLLDGVPITDSVNRAVIIPTIESVQEVKIQANTYDAEMGRTGGGVFNTYLKSGSNDLHGSGFGYIRETEWTANQFFNNRNGLPRQEQPFRNYGGSLGGPIRIPKLYDGRNKTFFWVGAEAYRQTSALASEFAVPTALERNGDFSQSLGRTGGAVTIFDPLTTASNGSGGPRPVRGRCDPQFPARYRWPQHRRRVSAAHPASRLSRREQLRRRRWPLRPRRPDDLQSRPPVHQLAPHFGLLSPLRFPRARRKLVRRNHRTRLLAAES